MHPQPHTPPPALQYGSVCSGIEAVSLAWQPLGLEPAWFAEIDPFPCAVLAHHYPKVPNLGDMTQIADRVLAGAVPAPDILVGGPPCQAFSIAGNRQGLDDPRGALTLNYVELANAIDQARLETHRPPATLVFENVPGLLNDRGNAFGCLLGALAGESRALEPPGKKWTYAGCVSGPRRRIAWRLLDAQYFGVAQRRRRVFLVASGRDDIDPAAVLFESDGVRGHPAPGHAPWQSAPGTVEALAGTAGDYLAPYRAYGNVTLSVGFGGGNTSGPIDIAACLTAQVGTKGDFEADTLLVQSIGGSISHALNTANNGKGCSEDGTGRGIPIIAFTAQDCGADAAVGLAPTMRAGKAVPAIAFAQNSRGELRWESGHGLVAGTLSTGGGKPGQGLPMIVGASVADGTQGVDAGLQAHFLYTPDETAPTGWPRWRVRRLMPLECERLQGMPDHYTRVPYRGKPAADAPRYKAIGNSMAVPCVAWVGQRLLQALA
ncbi:DNA cytosine methyltransferase [Pseudomonas lopnurensis]|uniref:DNA cytosine methyltransferase n=1 Tax=Pseudomonas lopnurensis TaxID=1477517 RepID=UPI0028AD5B57|nr:DNA cytosine methyltransferase [Pseudomonas lopnurensis]